MRFTPGAEIGGVRVSCLKKLFRIPGAFTAEFASHVVRRNEPDTRALIEVLLKDGYIEPGGDSTCARFKAEYGSQPYRLTLKGGALACATFGKPITLESARQMVELVKQSVEKYNSDPHASGVITRLVLFGSVNEGKPLVHDVDIGFETESRLLPFEELEAIMRHEEDTYEGQIRSFVHRLALPYEITARAIRINRHISPHPMRDVLKIGAKFTELYALSPAEREQRQP